MPPELNDTAAGGNEVDVDALMAELESPSKGAEDAAPPAAEKPAEPPAWDGNAWGFDWNGKKIVPDSQDKARTWMAQGYNYSQRMGDLNKTHAQRMAEADQKARAAADLETRFSPYSKVDEWARQNPAEWTRLQEAVRQAQQTGAGIDPNLAQVIKPLEEKLGKFESFIQAQEQARIEADNTKHDQALDGEIGEIRKQFPNIDLGASDPATGETLELRVLKHAQAIGTTSFRAAFRDYLHDQLVEQAKASGLEATAKTAEVNAKKGILGKTPAPVKGTPQPTGYVKGKSYDQLMREGLAEFGVT